MKAKLVKESLGKIPHFKDGWEIIEYFDTIPEFRPYKKTEEGELDDLAYEIPLSVFNEVLGWTKEELDEISDNLEEDEETGTTGHISYYEIESGDSVIPIVGVDW